MGLGRHGGGISSAAFFASLGARVLVTDLKKKSELCYSLKKLNSLIKTKNITYALNRHRKYDFKTADLIIRNPAVPNDSEYLTIARKNNIPVHTDISWFMVNLNLKIIGITGAKGKSTTAALLHNILTCCGKPSLLAGNIRKSPLDYLKIKNRQWTMDNEKIIILELSSWQLESLNEHKISPAIAVITNIIPDHLNRYKNFSEYRRAKSFIFKHQTKDDVLFLNQNDSVSRAIGEKQKIKSKIIWYNQSRKAINCASLSLHPDNIQAVLAVAKYLKLNKKSVQQAIKTFPELDGRLKFVDTVGGVKYYNDTCATQPEAAIFAIKQISKLKLRSSKLSLIAGGEDKKLDYDDLAQAIAQHIGAIILFKGSASDKIIKALKRQNRPISQHFNISTMKTAVLTAQKLSKPRDIVLLSPAAASFGLFKNEFDRGDQFKSEIAKIRLCP